MNDPKNDGPKDLVSDLEALDDGALEDVHGAGWRLKNVQVTSYDLTGGSLDTIYAGSVSDMIDGGFTADTIYAGAQDITRGIKPKF